ncbi:MAG: beta-ketoacyl-[acyl-carrier-protein] synthase II [Anaerolineales bacterium]|nr:beta-ketoacyl-[acyl-carrier-protein] synthase family protein [Anaerolineae bacterium]PWB69080.1 MAG: beta-ketoacyl-[acyl-carrier-protein] synthase II [Anaerolineales bacterium]
MSKQRVVVTGMGAVSSLGGVAEFWKSLLAGRSGIRRISRFDATSMKTQVAGEVDFDPVTYDIPAKNARRMSRASQMALAAASLAIADSDLTLDVIRAESERSGVVVGTANAGFEVLLETSLDHRLKGSRINPTALINGLPNMPAHYVSSYAGAAGSFHTVSATCASGTQSIGLALDQIRAGRADLMITGGVDTLIHPDVMKAFEAMTVLACKYGQEPGRAARPFDAERDGFVMGEGCGILVLESLEHARSRSARVYAEVLGYATSSDAGHSAAPDSEGRGAANAMQWALADAGRSEEEVDYINAHGTGTVVNDSMETKAIKHVFGERAYHIPISSTKSMIGHCMGGSGALEAIACVKSLEAGSIHPTINLETPDPECDLDYVPNQARHADLQVVLSNSFGLGGQNACLVLGRCAG